MYRRGDRGWVEVISGPMFSGKSEELIRRVTRSKIARIPVQVFKPVIDTRYADAEVVSHSSLSVDAIPVSDPATMLDMIEEPTVVVGIDEGQFFDDSLIDVTGFLAIWTTGDRCGPRPRLPRQTVSPDPVARCELGVRDQDAGCVPSLWRPCRVHPAHHSVGRTGRVGGDRCVRGSMSLVLQPVGT